MLTVLAAAGLYCAARSGRSAAVLRGHGAMCQVARMQLLQVTAGAVFHDDLGELSAAGSASLGIPTTFGCGSWPASGNSSPTPSRYPAEPPRQVTNDNVHKEQL
jgi:hypothetical protein